VSRRPSYNGGETSAAQADIYDGAIADADAHDYSNDHTGINIVHATDGTDTGVDSGV
jgi:hypothetical protein